LGGPLSGFEKFGEENYSPYTTTTRGEVVLYYIKKVKNSSDKKKIKKDLKNKNI